MRVGARVGCVLLAGVVLLGLGSTHRGAGLEQAGQVRNQDSRPAESSFAAGISRERISDVHRQLTSRPHMAGTEASRDVAEWLRRELDAAGLRTELVEYRPYLSIPRKIRIEITEPQTVTLTVLEPADTRDPDTAHRELGPGFVAYSASGVVSGDVVYVNYGLPVDYEALAKLGVDVRGRIVLARYARSHRAVKVATAEQAGAVGIIIYSDPFDDGYRRGEVWPEGPWRNDWMIQRGNAKYSWFWHGDPLTPGVGAREGAPRLDPQSVPTLPRIPAAVLSWHESSKMLRLLGGPPVPTSFQGGLGFEYRCGPGPVRVRMSVEMDAGERPIYNVLARLDGSVQPDRVVMLGTHHDAWTFGGVDPGSATAVMVEVARGLAALTRSGWRPARSIVFAIWDAEEFGLIGSTEFAEDRERELREQVVCYINSDLYMRGQFDAGGVPSLADFVAEIARDVPDRDGTVYDAWRVARASMPGASDSSQEAGPDLAVLGSGADFVAFQDYLGLPTLSMEFDFGGSYGAYHSNYDTRRYQERFGDPGFEQGAVLARVLGLAAMRLAGDRVLPFHYSRYARSVRGYVDRLPAVASRPAGGSAGGADLTILRARVQTLVESASELDRRIAQEIAVPRLSDAEVRRLNDRLVRIEQAMLDESETPRTRWYRHVVYGWNIYSLYDGQPLPGLMLAAEGRGTSSPGREIDRIGAALTRVDQSVRAALDLVPPVP